MIQTSDTQHSGNTISVMLVDDSSVIRGALTKLMDDDPSISIVASVPNGELAITSARSKKPDIVILDIEMPVMDGITALPLILEASPDSKVIMFSTLTEKGAAITMKALSLGAIECITKPAAGEAQKGGEFQTKLLNIIQNLCQENAQVTNSNATPKTNVVRKPTQSEFKKPEIVAIGSSTGGPQALFEVLSHCSGLSVPIVITQHMPATFTKILAQHIEQKTGIRASEGEDGMVLKAGSIYVAPGGFHMLFEKDKSDDVVIKLDNGPLINYCKPAVDPMFESLMKIYEQAMLAVILTGMGSDGLKSCQSLVESGGRVIAQDEKTSVVWGMPGAVTQAGLCSAILPLNDIGPYIKKAVHG